MADIKRGQRVTPRARVFAHIQDPIDRDGERVFVELLGFSSVNTNISMTGPGTATLGIPNYKSALMRFMNEADITALESTAGQTAASDVTSNTEFATSYMQDLLADDQDVYFGKLWEKMVINEASLPLHAYSNDGTGTNNGRAVENSGRSRGDLGSYKKTKEVLKTKGLIYSVPFVGLFDPIYVDYQGQDGLWYAGFTGLVTRIGDAYSVTGNQALTIQCKDYSVLFDNTSLISSWTRLTTAESNSSLSEFLLNQSKNQEASKDAFTNVFSKFNTVAEIILEVVSRAQEVWRLDAFKSESVGVKSVLFDTTKVYEYHGLSSRRGSVYSPEAAGDPEKVLPANFNKDYPLYEKHYQWTEGADTTDANIKEGNGLKHIFLDPLLLQFDNIFIHKMLSSSLSLFKESVVSPDDILNDLAAKMMAYKYFDANGNLIIELPKYNALPNLKDYAGRGRATALRHEAIAAVPGSSVLDTIVATESVELDPDDPLLDPDYKWATLNFHGKNYVMASSDFIGFDTSIDEDSIRTVVSIGATPANLNIGGELAKASRYFNGSAAASFDMLAKYGVRRFEAQNIYNVMLPNDQQSRILSYQAAAALERVNAQQDSGTFQAQHRPDMQVGRTFFNPLRMKSYLITSTGNSWSAGGMHSTTLTATFGHPIHKTLETPWTAIFVEPEEFGFEGATAHAFNKVYAIKDDGTEASSGNNAKKEVVIGVDNNGQ